MVKIAPNKTFTSWYFEQEEALVEMLKIGLNRKAIAAILRKTTSAVTARRELLMDSYYCTKRAMIRRRNPYKLPTHGKRVPYGMSLMLAVEIAKKHSVK